MTLVELAPGMRWATVPALRQFASMSSGRSGVDDGSIRFDEYLAQLWANESP